MPRVKQDSQISITCLPELHEALSHEARALGVPLGDLVRDKLELWLRGRDNDDMLSRLPETLRVHE